MSSSEMRQAAEERLRRHIDRLAGRQGEELIKQLYIIHLELEIQNEELRAAQLQLIQSNENYSHFYDHSPVGYCVIDKTGVIKSINRKGAEILNLSNRLCLNVPFAIFLHREDLKKFLRHVREVLLKKERQVCEVACKLDNGKNVFLRLESMYTRNSEGDELCRIVMDDITEISRLRNEINRLGSQPRLNGVLPICSH